jgi:uncharacterized SAM-binding protein YcdF (DUF218 family)
VAKHQVVRSRTRKILKWLLLLAVVWPIVAWLAARALVVSAPLPSADAIVVMSGSSAYLERTHKAAQLYHEGRAPLVLLTDDHQRGGWNSAQQRNPFFVERAMDALINYGVPANQIRVITGVASSTHAEALLIKDYAISEKLRSVLVVTSAYHSRRALRTLRRTFAGTELAVGLDPVPAGFQGPSPVFWWLQPKGWRTVGSEYVKLIYYWLKYD